MLAEKESVKKEIEENNPICTTGIEDEVSAIETKITGLNRVVGTIEENEKKKNRICELEELQSKYGKQIFELEGKLMLVNDFIVKKVSRIEEKVNNMFQITTFKLFHTQMNGDIDEVCISMRDGVEYKDLNHASKIQVGVDIVNVLQKYYDCFVPIWIDNRESTFWIPEVESQVISLHHSPEDKEMRIEYAA